MKEEVRRLHESCTLHLFDTVKDLLEVIRRKQIIDDLKLASTSARDAECILRSLLGCRA